MTSANWSKSFSSLSPVISSLNCWGKTWLGSLTGIFTSINLMGSSLLVVPKQTGGPLDKDPVAGTGAETDNGVTQSIRVKGKEETKIIKLWSFNFFQEHKFYLPLSFRFIVLHILECRASISLGSPSFSRLFHPRESKVPQDCVTDYISIWWYARAHANYLRIPTSARTLERRKLYHFFVLHLSNANLPANLNHRFQYVRILNPVPTSLESSSSHHSNRLLLHAFTLIVEKISYQVQRYQWKKSHLSSAVYRNVDQIGSNQVKSNLIA